ALRPDGRAARLDVGHRNRLLERRAERAARDAADFAALVRDRRSFAGDALALQFQPDAHSQGPVLAAAQQGVASEEIALVQLDRPRQPCLEGVRLLIQFVPVERHSGLQAQRVASAETAWLDTA